ncbi:MAG: hypothetical protein RLZZ214_3931 [Verrucomicrobiota bacterium]
MPLGGGGFVTGLASNATGNSIYCRTDVGGAFRWAPTGDAAGNGTWVSLSDDIVPFGSANASSLMGVESIAADPNHSNRVYIAAGNGIYLSDDQGGTWTLISPVIAMLPNGGFRACGERLAIDPNNPNVVWYGSVNNGLNKGDKTSGTWVWTQIPATAVPFGTVNGGVTFVVCDKNSGSTILYAGVDGTTTTGGIYMSTDNGGTWTKVGITDGQTLNTPQRAQVTSNGILYVTGGTNGVFKLLRGASTVLVQLPGLPTTIQYQSGSVVYRGVAVDPNDATGNTVYIAEGNWQYQYNNIWRSTNGGTTWVAQDTIFNGVKPNGSTISNARTEPDGTPCLTGYWFGNTSALLINPSNSSELWAADFFGVTRTRDAQNLGNNTLPPSGPGGCRWFMLQNGQEETVVAVVKNAPAGARLLTGVGDVGGCRYADTALRPTGASGNRFSNPSGGNTTSLDFSESDPNLWVRASVAQASAWTAGTGSFSKDSGANWLTFGQLDQTSIPLGTVNTWVEWDVAPYLKQHLGGMITLIVRGNSTGPLMTFDSKEGANPPQVLINGTTPLTVTEDTFVQDGTSAAINNGTSTTLLAKLDATNFQRWTYLKFDLTGITSLTTAKLRMFLQSTTATAQAAVYAASVTSWTEGELTWNTRPLHLGVAGTYASTIPPILVNGSNGGGAGRIAISATDPGHIVWMPINYSQATIPAYSSKDRGVTWNACTGAFNSPIAGVYTNGNSLGMSGQCLAADRGNGQFYLAKLGGASHLIYRSSDGAAWTQVGSVNNGGTYNMRTPQLAAAPVSPACPQGGDVWLCDDGTWHVPADKGYGLWRSTNSGATWSTITTMNRVTAIGFGKAASGTGYAVFVYGLKGTTLGIYRSDDYGVNWVKLPNPTIEGITALAGDRQNFGNVFLGTGGRGVFQAIEMVAPAITAQPQGQNVAMGGTATLSVTATGTAPTYQWRFNGNPLAGQTAATLSLNDVTLGQAGNYSVTVTNAAGTVTSDPAWLTVQATYTQWAGTHFTSQELAAPEISGMTATPQNDELPNLLKYLFHIDPAVPMTAADRAALPAVGLVTLNRSTYLTLTYRSNAAATGMTVNLQASADFGRTGSWEIILPDVTETLATDALTGDRIIRLKVLVTGISQKFVRLKAVSP